MLWDSFGSHKTPHWLQLLEEYVELAKPELDLGEDKYGKMEEDKELNGMPTLCTNRTHHVIRQAQIKMKTWSLCSYYLALQGSDRRMLQYVQGSCKHRALGSCRGCMPMKLAPCANEHVTASLGVVSVLVFCLERLSRNG